MYSKATLETILSHRSIRKFTPQLIEADIINTLIDAARMASTSNHLQAVSIIRITDPALRQPLMEYCSHQPYVQSAPEFWVFCADFSKQAEICPEAQLQWTEVLLIGAVDCGIAAQNVLLGAESLGLGGVFIGSLRNHMAKVGELLQLPSYVLPIVGLCLGYPAQNPPLKPRLPAEMLCFENQHQPLDREKLTLFDQVTAEYYYQRNKIDNDWSRNVQKALSKPIRPDVLAYLQQQGFAKC
ncbi:nitroreductase A [Mergibacter septicus]|nr:nitroreductase A [Mergibacter septicus]